VLVDGPPYPQLEEVGSALIEGLRKLGEASGLPMQVQGLPMAFHVSFGDGGVTDYRSLQTRDAELYRRLADALVAEGVWVARRGIWYVSAAHRVEEVEVTLERAEAALGRI
jgi:glutamate-1-semialdehyde 2,1-aminomutase